MVSRKASAHRMGSRMRRDVLAATLSLCIAGGAHAQTNTAGAVAGRASAGDTISLVNPATGFSRSLTVTGDGSYRFSQIPIGVYTVTRRATDGSTASREARVNVGTAANVDFVQASSGGGDANTLDTITVVGTGAINPIDVTSVESTTILTAEQIAKIPVQRNITQVALLAPGTVRGDAAFGNLASFGGASVAENQYFLNGFNITNSFKGLAFSQVPFEGIAEQQIKTGGYGAEFGRSLGGVINLISKRGTNDFQAGGNVIWSPESLRAGTKNTYYQDYVRNDGLVGPVGAIRSDNSKDNLWQSTAAAWAGGAIVKDRLFFYGLIQYNKDNTDTYGPVTANTNTNADGKNPNGLLKLDWNINDSNLLEFTAFTDKDEDTTRYYNNALGSIDRGTLLGTSYVEQGGNNYVLRYTGYLTDNFTVSALAGTSTYKRNQRLRTAAGAEVEYGGDITQPASGCPVILDARTAARRAVTGTYVSTCNITGAAITRSDAEDTRDQYRVDAEWSLGDHLLRFGVDIDNYTTVDGGSIEGGRQWRYATATIGGVPTDIVREQIVNQGATVDVKQRAFYVQDSWSVTPNFIAYLGARVDKFENLNGDGETFVEIEDQFSPRLGFSWDVFSDSTFKVFGNAGRYALPLTPTVAIRGASASLFTRQAFRFTGVDPVTGAPIGLSPTGRAQDNFTFINGEFGRPKNPLTIASTNLEPQYQDEFILGFQKSLTDHLAFGTRGIYRELKRAIDDTCDYRPFAQYADDNGLPLVLPNDSFPYCRLFNPGEDVITPVDVDNDGDLEVVEVDGDLLSPPAKRTYSAIEFFVDGNWDKFFLQGSYTYAKSKGNTEGGVKSDIGQGDTNVTQDFDYPELTDRTYGYLPNDRRHSFKLFGNYEITDEWSVGANLIVQSGRPKNCIGRDYYEAGDLGVVEYGASVGDPKPYGAAYFRCANINNDEAGGRGGAGRLPWTRTLDLNAAYRPSFLPGLQFKVDVFNAANTQEVVSVSETGEDGTTGASLDTYAIPTSFQAPRSVRFLVQYDWK